MIANHLSVLIKLSHPDNFRKAIFLQTHSIVQLTISDDVRYYISIDLELLAISKCRAVDELALHRRFPSTTRPKSQEIVS